MSVYSESVSAVQQINLNTKHLGVNKYRQISKRLSTTNPRKFVPVHTQTNICAQS